MAGIILIGLVFASTWVADGSGDRPARGHLVVANGKVVVGRIQASERK